MSLIAYDDDGKIIAYLDRMARFGEDGAVIGLVDFEGHEEAGGEHTDFWIVDGARGSKAWPGPVTQPHEWNVELSGPPGLKRLNALVHRRTGERSRRPAGQPE